MDHASNFVLLILRCNTSSKGTADGVPRYSFENQGVQKVIEDSKSNTKFNESIKVKVGETNDHEDKHSA